MAAAPINAATPLLGLGTIDRALALCPGGNRCEREQTDDEQGDEHAGTIQEMHRDPRNRTPHLRVAEGDSPRFRAPRSHGAPRPETRIVSHVSCLS